MARNGTFFGSFTLSQRSLVRCKIVLEQGLRKTRVQAASANSAITAIPHPRPAAHSTELLPPRRQDGQGRMGTNPRSLASKVALMWLRLQLGARAILVARFATLGKPRPLNPSNRSDCQGQRNRHDRGAPFAAIAFGDCFPLFARNWAGAAEHCQGPDMVVRRARRFGRSLQF
jgi:hypothetical protein